MYGFKADFDFRKFVAEQQHGKDILAYFLISTLENFHVFFT